MTVVQSSELRKLLKIQLLMVVCVPILLIPFGLTVVKSAFFGAVIVTISSHVSAMLAFGKYTAQKPEKILVKFYGAEIIKLTIVIALFVLIMLFFKPLNIVALLTVFFMTQVFPALFQVSGKSG